MGDIHVPVVPGWDLNSMSRRNSNNNNSAFVCVQRRSSANGMRGFVLNADPKVSSSEEDILNCNNELNNSWTRGCSLYDMIPSLQLKIGSNALAIDNKIGEAMDLVKSHLMLTVRAEVAVLKEQIKELKEKNSKLEYENSILKASASPETLTKLSQP